MNGIFDTYSRISLNFKCQSFDVSGKRGASKTKLLSATRKYNFEMKFLKKMFSHNLFSGKSVRLKHLLTDYSAFSLFTIKINLTCPHQWVSSTYCSDFHILQVMPYISKVYTDY